MNGHRDWGGPSEEHQPVTYWRGYGIYASHLIVIVYCVLMIVTAVAGQHIAPAIAWTAFKSELVHAGQVWRLLSYGLFNFPDLGFAFDMLMLVWFGRELERFYGRRLFLWLYGGIYVLAPLVLTVGGFIRPTALFGQPGALALFVAFATQFPGMPVFFTLLAKWAALILVGIYTLLHLSRRDWISLTVLWTTCGYAHLFVRHQQGLFTLPSLKFLQRKPPLRALPDLPEKKNAAPARPAREDATMAEVDALLDKIAKSGMSSLTAKERAKLEAARADLMKRDAGRS